jgi:hypothetical protein
MLSGENEWLFSSNLFQQYPFLNKFISDHPDVGQIFRQWPIESLIHDLKECSLRFRKLSGVKLDNVLKHIIFILGRKNLKEIATKCGTPLSSLRVDLTNGAYRILEDLQLHHIKQGNLSKPLSKHYHNSAQWLEEIYLKQNQSSNPILSHSVVSQVPMHLRSDSILDFLYDCQSKQRQRGETSVNKDLSEMVDRVDDQFDTSDTIPLIELYLGIVKLNPPFYGGLIRIGKLFFRIELYEDILKLCDFILKSRIDKDTRISTLILLSNTLREISKRSYRKQDVENSVRAITDARSLQPLEDRLLNILLSFNAFAIYQEFAPQDSEFAKKAIYQWDIFVDDVSQTETNFPSYRNKILEDINSFLLQKDLESWFREQLTAFIQRHQNH